MPGLSHAQVDKTIAMDIAVILVLVIVSQVRIERDAFKLGFSEGGMVSKLYFWLFKANSLVVPDQTLDDNSQAGTSYTLSLARSLFLITSMVGTGIMAALLYGFVEVKLLIFLFYLFECPTLIISKHKKLFDYAKNIALSIMPG